MNYNLYKEEQYFFTAELDFIDILKNRTQKEQNINGK